MRSSYIFELHVAYAPVYSLGTISVLRLGANVSHLSSPNSILVSSQHFCLSQTFYTLSFCWLHFCSYIVFSKQLFVTYFIGLSYYRSLSKDTLYLESISLFLLPREQQKVVLCNLDLLKNIWIGFQLEFNSIIYLKCYNLQFVVIVYGLINDQSSIHVLTHILLEISKSGCKSSQSREEM